jgi:MarR family transcriptional regulator, transcriptional regulator for hemolysin
MTIERTRRSCDNAPKDETVIPTVRNRKREVGLKMDVVTRRLRQSFDQSVERSGLTRSKWTLIAAVAMRQGATQRILAEALQVKEITVGRLIDRLCEEGYLKRRPHPSDGRAYCVHLAPPAQPVLDKLNELARAHEAMVFAGFDDADLDKLLALLDAVERNMSVASNDTKKKRLAASG